MHYRKLMVVGGVAVALGFGLTGYAWAQGATVREGESNTTVTNPCNGEQVALHNEFRVVSNVFEDENGTFHSTIHLTQQSTGEGLTTGAKYHAALQTNSTRQVDDPDNFVGTVTSTQTLISQGGGENFRATFHFKVTVVDGETKVEFVRVDTDCSG